MNVFELPFALLTFLGFVAFVPAWTFFVREYGSVLTVEGQFLIGLALPATVLLAIASWLQPRGA